MAFAATIKRLLRKRDFKSVAVLDDFFPHPLSAFRFAEYVKLLNSIEQLNVYSTGGSLHFVSETRTLQEIINAFDTSYPSVSGRVHKLDMDAFPQSQLFYTIFINNAAAFIEKIEEQNAELIFTLYPGGGFHLDEEASDIKLRRVFNSPSFRRVIVTQKLTLRYLIKKNLCPPQKIEFIFGGVPGMVHKIPGSRNYYGFDKDRLDIAFAANRYSRLGAEKGYDVFIAAAKQILQEFPNVHFHVIGKYDAGIINVDDMGDRISFYGFREREFLDDFYRNIDILVSPNKPWDIIRGAFDGFPTGSAVEAVLRGVALVCSDPYHLNVMFSNQRDIIIVDTDENEIAQSILILAADPKKLRSLAKRGQVVFERVFGDNAQINPRVKMLKRR